jgi:hypothetical protein
MSDRKIKKTSLTALAASTWEFGEEPPKTMVQPSGRAKARFLSARMPAAVVLPFPNGPVQSDNRRIGGNWHSIPPLLK